MPFVFEQGEARYWYARMLVDRDAPGDRERARTMLDRALGVYGRIGMPWHAKRADRLIADSFPLTSERGLLSFRRRIAGGCLLTGTTARVATNGRGVTDGRSIGSDSQRVPRSRAMQAGRGKR